MPASQGTLSQGGFSFALCYNSLHINNWTVATTMKFNREAKNLLAMMALVLAIVLALNAQLGAQGNGDMWSWALGVLALAVLLWLWSQREGKADEAGTAESLADEAEDLAKRTIVRHADIEAETASAGAAYDDLTRINGVGAVFQTALYQAGVTSYAALADVSLDELEALLEAAGRSRPGRLETWPRQASFAAAGDWDGLRQYLDSLQD